MDSSTMGSSSNSAGGGAQGKAPLTFAAADQMYVSLKRLFDTGVLTADAFDAQLKQMMIQDSAGHWWSKSRESGEWFYFDGSDWVQGTPPVESTVPTEVKGELGTTAVLEAPRVDEQKEVVKREELDLVTREDVKKEEVKKDIPGDLVGTPPPAELGPRIIALLIDSALLFVAGAILGAVGLAALSYLIGIGYFVYYWSTTGQTLGMKSQNLRVVRVDGQPLTWETGVLRYVGYFLGALCIFIGLLWVFWDPQRQGWHDKIAHTLVVRATP